MRKKRYLKLAFLLLLASVILQLAARNISGFGQWYAVTVYPILAGNYGRMTGLFPCSVAEIGLYILVVWLLWSLARLAVQPFGKKNRNETARKFRESSWALLGCQMLFGLSLLAFTFTINCGINYYRRPFSSYLDLEIRQSSKEELLELCQYLTDQVNEAVSELAEEEKTEKNSGFSRKSEAAGTDQFLREWEVTGRQAMKQLGEQYPELDGYYPKPKGLLVSRILSVQQLCGIYSPFTMEANYNREMTAYNIPHTICHELSHLKGFMREDEANFIGYLACVQSEDAMFRYSGYLTGWIYAGNALAKVDMEAYSWLYGELDQKVVSDLQENTRFWNQFEGKVAEAANKMNDTYLKINDQSDGVQSYGRVVDLMLAVFRKEHTD